MAELLPEVEQYLSTVSPKNRADLDRLFRTAGTRLKKPDDAAQRETLASLQFNVELERDIQDRMPYRAPPIDISKYRFHATGPETQAYTLKGMYVYPYIGDTKMTKGVHGSIDFGKGFSYDEDDVEKFKVYPLESDTVNVFEAPQADLPTISHEYRHRLDMLRGESQKGFPGDRETIIRVQDLMTSGNLQEVKDQMKSLANHIFLSGAYTGEYTDDTAYDAFVEKLEEVFDAEEQAQRDAGETGLVLLNKRAQNPEPIRRLMEQLKIAQPTFINAKGQASYNTPPVARVLETLENIERQERYAAERQDRPLKNMLLLSDLRRSRTYKDLMGIDEPFRYDDGTYMEEPSILQRVGEGIESLMGGRSMSEIIDEELIERAKNVMMAPARVMQGAPEEKAMGGPVGGLDVYFNQMRMM